MKLEQVYAALDSLLDYAKNCELLHPLDETFARNALLAELKLESYEKQKERYEFPECLNLLCDYAAENGQINDTIAERDLFDTRLMGCVTPRPSEVVRKFWSLYAESPKTATDYFYKLSQDCNYIRRDRIAKDEHWVSNTKYGELEISINLSKPEKDPRDIAAAKLKKASGYPKCLLCVENVGYAAPGKACIYNILIMEEKQTIVACGAGTTTKVTFPAENRLERAENVKDVASYIERIDEMIDRKEKLLSKLV